MKTCDYCGKPMALWVGIKRTCFDEQCRKSAREDQKDGPIVNQYEIMRMIEAYERRRDTESQEYSYEI